jgi:hypothetical protein
MAGIRPWIPALILAAVVLVAASIVRIGHCDGPAPGWVENRGGCAEWAPIEYAFPWHWGVPDQCLGLCDDSLTP